MYIPAISLFLLLTLGYSLAEDFVYEFGSHADDPIIYITDGKLGMLEYEKEIPILLDSHLQLRYVKVLISSLSPPKVEYDAKYKKIIIKYSWAQAPPLGGKFRVEVHGSTAITETKHGYIVSAV